jgi:hypothetical protein|tara:strand:+ start:598 stop:825 length:228 start_codon:yes stop_codon:yes gene_type:complete
MNDELTKEQRKELNDLVLYMAEEAVSVKLDYEQSGSNLDSGSIVVVHENSPLLIDETERLSDVVYNLTKKEKKNE